MQARYRKNMEYGQDFLNHDVTNWGNDVKINVRENATTKSSINFKEQIPCAKHNPRLNNTFKSNVVLANAQPD